MTWMHFTAGLIIPHSHTFPALTSQNHLHPLPHPHPPHWIPKCTQDLWRGCMSALSQTEDQEDTMAIGLTQDSDESAYRWVAEQYSTSFLLYGSYSTFKPSNPVQRQPFNSQHSHHCLVWSCNADFKRGGPPLGHSTVVAMFVFLSTCSQRSAAHINKSWLFIAGMPKHALCKQL